MATKINQQETLFRFISIRPPELTETNSNPVFVSHPGNSGAYFDAVTNRPIGQSKWQAMEIESGIFKPFKIQEIETLYPQHASASNWLVKNKDKATSDEIKTKLGDLDLILAADITKLWDNLFYQVIQQEDFYVKEMSIQLLVLQNLLEQTKSITGFHDIKKLANAMVLLPVELFVEDKTEDSVPANTEDIPIFSIKELNSSLNKSFAKFAIDRNQKAIAELKKFQKKYQENYNEQFNNVNTQYEKDIETAYNNATYVEKEAVDCTSGCPYTYREYENLVLPVYEFEPPTEIDAATLKYEMSESSWYVIDSLNLYEEKTYEDIIQGINRSTEDYNKIIFENLPNQKRISFGGMLFANNASQNPFLTQNQLPFIASFKKTSAYDNKGKLFLSIDVGYENPEIASLKYSGPGISETDFEYTSEGNILNLTLFPSDNGLTIPSGEDDFILDAEITLTNGTSFDISSTIKTNQINKGIGGIYARNNKPAEPVTALEPHDFGIRRLGIADYKKVVSEVCCYRESEVSHIENIMAREFRSKSTERERIEETSVTTENVFEKENLTDTTTTERLEMQSEVAKVLQNQKQTGAYANVHGTYNGVTFETGGTFASNTAKEESNRQALIESKEITEVASERITTRFREEIVRKITERFKEENSHIFDNRAGENHVSGIYRFINAVNKNQIYNYGKRLMYEFMIPDPSRIHRLGSKVPDTGNTVNNDLIISLKKPLPPSAGGIMNASQVVDSNYLEFAAMNNAAVEAPPEQYPTLGQAFDGKGNNAASSTSHEIKIPEGYKVVVIRYSFTMMRTNVNLYAKLQLGKYIIPIMATPSTSYQTSVGGTNNITDTRIWIPTDSYSMNSLPISVIGWDLGAYTLNITLTLERTAESFQNWQTKTYNALIAAYNDRVEEYNAQVGQVQEEIATTLETNPLFYREIEQSTLKRNCISYLLDNMMGNGNYTGGSFTTYGVTRNQAMDDYASLAKFMEQAFEWNIMSYNFYPYYWADSNKWLELYQTENDDLTFRKFMQAGMARVIVTVRPGFEDAVMYYMVTKKIWNGGQMPVLNDPLYVSITKELQEQEYFIDGSWETVVPTSLIGLQKGGVAIDKVGLPCGDGCDGGPNPLVPNDHNLGPQETPTNP